MQPALSEKVTRCVTRPADDCEEDSSGCRQFEERLCSYFLSPYSVLVAVIKFLNTDSDLILKLIIANFQCLEQQFAL